MVSGISPSPVVLGADTASITGAGYTSTPLALTLGIGAYYRVLLSFVVNTAGVGGIDYNLLGSGAAPTWVDGWFSSTFPTPISTRFTTFPMQQLANHVGVASNFRDSMELWISTAAATTLTFQIKPTVAAQKVKLLRGSSMIVQLGSPV